MRLYIVSEEWHMTPYSIMQWTRLNMSGWGAVTYYMCMTTYSGCYHLYWQPPLLPCTMAGQEVNETSCLVHARIPLSSKKRHSSQGEAFFTFYILSSGREPEFAHTSVHRTAFKKNKISSRVCFGTLCKTLRPSPIWIKPAKPTQT